MSQFFLLNEAVETTNYEKFVNGMSALVAIKKEEEHAFFRHNTFWHLEILNKLYENSSGFTEKVIYGFIESLISHDNYYTTEASIDAAYPGLLNAFLGIDFNSTVISFPKQITDDAKYKELLLADLWNISFRNLWVKRRKLFPHLTLCGEVENQLLLIGASPQFNQIVERLVEFDNAVKNWKTGSFSYKEINKTYALRISPESDSTISKFGNERLFRLPGSNMREYFFLHIKTGELRFHFYPDNVTKKVYVGYIGPHLSTVSN